MNAKSEEIAQNIYSYVLTILPARCCKNNVFVYFPQRQKMKGKIQRQTIKCDGFNIIKWFLKKEERKKVYTVYMGKEGIQGLPKRINKITTNIIAVLSWILN